MYIVSFIGFCIVFSHPFYLFMFHIFFAFLISHYALGQICCLLCILWHSAKSSLILPFFPQFFSCIIWVPVTKSKLIPLTTQQASELRDKVLGQEKWVYSKASRSRRSWTHVLKHHLNLGLISSCFYVKEEGRSGRSLRSGGGSWQLQTSGRQQGAGEGCETPCTWLVDFHWHDSDYRVPVSPGQNSHHFCTYFLISSGEVSFW